MVKISKFQNFTGATFSLTLDSSVKTLQTDSFFVSFYLKIVQKNMIATATAGASTRPFKRLTLDLQSTNLATGVFALTSGITTSAPGDLYFLEGGATSATSDASMFAGLFGTGGAEHSSQILRVANSSGTTITARAPIHFNPNQWHHIVMRKVRGSPGGLRIDGTDFGLLSQGTTSTITSTPQAGIKFQLRLTDVTEYLEGIEISNVWCGAEDSTVPDFIDREYLKNFVNEDGTPIEITGDGTIGTITPAFYFKGENDDPLFDTVSQTQATVSGADAAIKEGDFSCFYENFTIAVYGDSDFNLERCCLVRPEGLAINQRSSRTFAYPYISIVAGIRAGNPGTPDRPPMISTICSINSTQSSAGNYLMLGGYIPRSSTTGIGLRLGVAGQGRQYLAFPNTAGSGDVGLLLARKETNDATSVIRGFTGFTANQEFSQPSSLTVNTSTIINYACIAPYRFSIAYDADTIAANPQIDWFGDPEAFLENFFDYSTLRVKRGGMFGEDFLGVLPTYYVDSRFPFLVRVGALAGVRGGNLSGSDVAKFIPDEYPRSKWIDFAGIKQSQMLSKNIG